MKSDTDNYRLYLKFIEAYSPAGFKGIDRNDPLILELEEFSEQHNQFFHVADLVLIQIIWASTRSAKMIGIPHEELNAYHFFEATHPDDIYKHTLGRSKLMDFANDLYNAKKGKTYLSMNIRIRNSEGKYEDLLFQLLFFYSEIHKTVFLLQVHTNIESFKKPKYGYHYYVGDDLSLFRYPDEEMLKIGIPFTNREFEIIKLIEAGLDSNQIAERLFLSVYTVNTHRGNILEKTDFKNISDLIYDLQKKRLL